MCRVKGTAPNRDRERCEKCNDPEIRRDRQNLANSVKRVEASIAQEKTAIAVEEPTAPKEATLGAVLAESVTETEGFNDEEVAQVIDDMLADGSAAKSIATNLRSERESMGNEAWLLKGEENTPENLAKGLAARQQEIMIAGGLIAERAQAIHGVDVDVERQNWADRTAQFSKDHERLKAENDIVLNDYIAYNKSLMNKEGGSSLDYEDKLSDEDKTELARRQAERIASAKALKESEANLALALAGEDPETLALAHKIADANRQAIAEVRAVGNVPVVFSNTVRGDANEVFSQTVNSTFPDEWVKNSNDGSELIVKRAMSNDGRAHYADIVQQPYLANTTIEPDPQDIRFKGWEKRYDEDGNFTGKWHGVQKDVLQENNPRDAKKFKADGTPKGLGWEKGVAVTKDGGHVPVWVRDNPEDKKRSQLALATGETSEITVNTKTSSHDFRTTVQHEFSHRIETTNPHIPMMEEAFLASRTTNADGTRDRLIEYRADDIVLPATSRTREAIRPDNFVDPYIGKEYKGKPHREVLSMGTEAVFGGSHGGFVGIGNIKTDHSMRNWVLGMYAVA